MFTIGAKDGPVVCSSKPLTDGICSTPIHPSPVLDACPMTNFHDVFVVWKDASVPVAPPHEQESIGIPENGILCLNDGGGTNYIPFGLFKEGNFVPGLDLSHWDAYPLEEDFQFIIFVSVLGFVGSSGRLRSIASVCPSADSPLDPVPDPTLPLTPLPSVSSRGKAPPLAPAASPPVFSTWSNFSPSTRITET
ncbi:hypothetical protein CTheo_7898 [Ceratobasidium theobromae]|uniref:Uncharacterized protein n=1 Tax=Ceratobasidium theobromae TaxID=1582974 RepID=A0A5N5QA42_9AGAM|nr:hypothetical protein CTheo_7898 [Ceratobasidium theobromae]